MLSSHRIQPPIVTGFSDHALDQSSLNAPPHLLLSERVNVSSERTSMSLERPVMLNERMTFANERPSYSSERSSFVNDRPSFASDRPSFLNDRSRLSYDRSSVLSDRQNVMSDRANTMAERPNPMHVVSQRSHFSTDRPNVTSDRKNITADRCPVPNGRHNTPDERRYSPDARPVVSNERPNERPTMPFERQNSRPAITIELATDRPTISAERPHMPVERSVITADHGRQSKSPHNPNHTTPDSRQPVHPAYPSKTSIFRGEILRGPNDTQSHADSREFNNRFEGQRNHQTPSDTPGESDDKEYIQPRLQDNSYVNNRFNFHMRSPTHNPPKLSENHSQVYTNYSMVSTNAVRPIMVPTTSHDNVEKRLNIATPPTRPHTIEHNANDDKSRWKNFEKNPDYHTATSSLPKNVMPSDSHVMSKYTIPHSHPSMPPFTHSNITDKQPPSYSSVFPEKLSRSPKHFSYTEGTEKSYLEKPPYMTENSFLSDRQSTRHYMPSRSPSNMPEQTLNIPELTRKGFVQQDNNNNNSRPPFATKRPFYSRNSPERYEQPPEPPVSMSARRPYSPSKIGKISPREIPVTHEPITVSTHRQTFPYGRPSEPERPSMLSDRPAVISDYNPVNPTSQANTDQRLPDNHTTVPEKSRVSPVIHNGSPSVAELRTMSEIQPLHSDTSNFHYLKAELSEAQETSHNASVSTARPSVNPPVFSLPVDTVSVSIAEASVKSEIERSESTGQNNRQSPETIITSAAPEEQKSTDLPPTDYPSHDSEDRSLGPSPHSHVNAAPNFNDISDGDDVRDVAMASPLPPVVILNPDDTNSEGDGDSIGDNDYDNEHEDDHDNENDHEMDDAFTEKDEDMNGHSPLSMRDHHVLSSERPSMLSDSPSMVSAMVRPSMVGNDGNGENNMGDPSHLLSSPSDKPNVVKRGKRKKYQKYTPADRIAIGKFCFEHGPAAARKAFQSRYPEMSESVTRGFRDKYKLMIGEYAVYVFEQKRRREMNVRTESLPRGRPRKYKQIETADDKQSLPTTTTTVSVSPPTYQATPPSLPDPHSQIRDENGEKENIAEAPKTYVKNEYTREEKLLIGWYCAKHGGESALKVFNEEHPDLTLEMVVAFHKMYIESEGQMADNEKTDVYVVDTDHNELQSPPSSTGSIVTSPHDYNQNGMSSPNGSTEMTSGDSTENRKSAERELESSTKPDEIVLGSSENTDNVSPVTSPPRTVVTYPVSPHSITPIIHYPKISSDNALRVHPGLEPRDYKHEYKVDHNGGGEPLGYPYDRQIYMYGDDPMTNGPSSLPRTKRFKYQKYSPEDRYNIGKLCNDIGLGATVKVYREQFPRLNESVVRTFRNKYRELLQKGNGVPVAEAIQRKPSRRSITTLIESEVVSQLRQLKQSNIEMTEKLVIAVAENIISTKEQKDIGPVKNTVTKEWASSLLWKHKLVERQVSNPNGVCCERCKTPLVCPKC